MGSKLRRIMIDSGMSETMASEILRAAAHPDYYTLRTDPRQRDLPYGQRQDQQQ